MKEVSLKVAFALLVMVRTPVVPQEGQKAMTESVALLLTDPFPFGNVPAPLAKKGTFAGSVNV